MKIGDYSTMHNKQKILVTSPTLPPLEDFIGCVKEIYQSKWLTNNGRFHQAFEKALCEFAGMSCCSLFCNGTIALEALLSVTGLKGEVITTPFTFAATATAIVRCGLKPVFVDIDPLTLNLDPAKAEEAITENTAAILPVHVYGNPCQTQALEKLADKYNLSLIYDAAHAFGVEQNGESILKAGSASMVSFHATKVFSSIEGGAIFTEDPELKRKLDLYKNFGISGQASVELIGTNGKMNEFQAAFGLLSLEHLQDNIEKRQILAEKYRSLLKNVQGISLMPEMPGVKHNYAYFPILVDKEKFGKSRDELYEKLKESNIYARKYFYPLITDFAPYKDSSICRSEDLPAAKKAAEKVLCLPVHTELNERDIEMICEAVYWNY
ncbi:DegT/DnrJ/EryC1/StrS family aminotransferase [Sedimentisphaera salicampi]|uniref:DegT/DnrJ/EryC1/StrS family aminotransferase n=1 Tax=Sedimentisphaera salicampi TaxID=1941349 RepID=UPI000B9CF364|nr:DegT/DnrJ/EryC1/StrS family aminotransferase [Sedimentisphaera salicampi]OXU15582.1 UDP-4-amino-4-deoxy-L-arabinose--oxoglutarate aminotransferase [Sedimentisphaera salicampi]